MPTSPYLNPFMAQHTFGRGHIQPPPLPSTMQQGQLQQVQQMGDSTAASVQQVGELPHDFDHIVRSVGEW